jgi:hypothetical protein
VGPPWTSKFITRPVVGVGIVVGIGVVVTVTVCVEGETLTLNVVRLVFGFVLSDTAAVFVKTGTAPLVRIPETKIGANTPPGATGGPV